MRLLDNAFTQVLRQWYETLFVKPWPTMTGAVLIGILSVVSFAWARPWGVAGGYRAWGDWLLYGIGLLGTRPQSLLVSSNGLMTLGLIWGAMAVSLISRDFAIRVPPRLEFCKGVAGGALMGVGAACAGGCNVGGFYSSISALSLSGLVMLVGLLAGAWMGLKYLYWEMEHLPATPSAPAGQGDAAEGPRFDWARIKPLMGWLLLCSGYAVFLAYRYQGHVILGGVLLCGIGFGVILGRSRFCFARCFREPFMTGEGEVPRAVIVSLLISLFGFAVLKWTGLRAEAAYVTPTFGLGALVGGAVFGFGMLLAGGCGSGTAWRAAEGQVKLMVALFFFCLCNSLAKLLLGASATLRTLVGFRVYLPDHLGYQGAIWIIVAVLLVWYAVVTWNERTDAFVVEM